VLAFLAILALGLPLWKLTGGAAEAVVAVPTNATDAKAAPVRLQLTFTAVPTSVKVLHLGKEIWTETPGKAEMERTFQLEYPKEGIDLQFDIEWPGEGICAMRASLTDPEKTVHEKSVWGHGAVSEVLTFP
jgi:hypothetical protein